MKEEGKVKEYGAWQRTSKEEDIEDKRIKTLIKKSKELMGEKQKLAQFKEPVLFLIRRNNVVEFYEAVPEAFKFKHSNGKEMELRLHPAKRLRFNYANESFIGYIHNEDSFLSEPQKPLVDATIVKDYYDQAVMTSKKYEEERKLEKEKGGNTIMTILAIAGIVLAMGFAANMILQNMPSIMAALQQNAEPAAQAAETVIANATEGVTTI